MVPRKMRFSWHKMLGHLHSGTNLTEKLHDHSDHKNDITTIVEWILFIYIYIALSLSLSVPDWASLPIEWGVLT